MNVLVLDGNQNQAVACVRSLALQGHAVFAGEVTSFSKAGWSRLCSGAFRYPAPSVDAAGFIAALLAQLHSINGALIDGALIDGALINGALIIPCSDATTLLVSAHRDVLLAAGARLVLPSHQDVLRALDKNATTLLAAHFGVPVPKTWTASREIDVQHLAESVTYPVVLKPQRSEEFLLHSPLPANTHSAGRPRYASNAKQFLAAFPDVSSRTSSVLVQEFIPGTGTGYFALMCHGELRAEFAHRRIRDVHPAGSGSALRESMFPDSRVREAALAILRALNWHGVAMVEFRVRKDGMPVFLEVNGRFWNSLPLACYAGVNFPALLAQVAEHGDVAPVTGYRPGVRCRWLLGDFRHLLAVWRGPPPGYPERFPSRLRTLASFLIPVPGTYHDNFQLADPLPELADWLSAVRRFRSGSLRNESDA